tara:strand:+ start:5686 stop:5919 length:234 start_codon:yes stop_codon:yes gene_type:complete
MLGVIIRHGQNVVIVTAETLEEAEHIALELLSSVGVELEGEEVSMLVFSTSERGGVILEMDQSDDMEGWSMDGFNAP